MNDNGKHFMKFLLLCKFLDEHNYHMHIRHTSKLLIHYYYEYRVDFELAICLMLSSFTLVGGPILSMVCYSVLHIWYQPVNEDDEYIQY
jgi:hypothetical protein